MGTDIHAITQKKTPEGYEDVPHLWEQDRHYFLFAWLAGVRNGYGFAGVPTHTPIKPIAEPRGLPEDFAMDGDIHPCTKEMVNPRMQKYWNDKEDTGEWMGGHTHSWLTFSEILNAKLPAGVWRTGIISREEFEAWDGVTPPESWSGGISGGGIVVAEAPTLVDEKTTHVRIYFKQDNGTLDYFIDEIKRLKDLHGEGRVVFGFDS